MAIAPLIPKVQRKLYSILEGALPFNTHLRPRQAFASSLSYRGNNHDLRTRVHAIYPACRTRLPITREFYDSITSYYNYNPAVETPGGLELDTQADYVVVEMDQGRMITDNLFTVAYITADGTLLGDISFQHRDSQIVTSASENAAMSNRYFRRPTQMAGTVFSMLAGGGSAENYGHWLIDALPRLHLLKKAGLFDQVDHFLVPAFRHDYHRDTLRLLGVDLAKVIQVSTRMHIQADRLIATTHPRGSRSILLPEWLIDFHRETFLPMAKPTGRFGKRIFISRADTSMRPVENEAEVIAALKPHGFEVHTLSPLSFLEKVELHASAEMIITSSGAGMNNLVYCQPGARMLEIFPKGLVHIQFYNIAHYLGMPYRYVISIPSVSSQSVAEGRNEKIRVPMDTFMTKVEELLAIRD